VLFGAPRPADVVGLVLRHILLLSAASLIAGLAGALFATATMIAVAAG
jgi:hypothetical protein